MSFWRNTREFWLGLSVDLFMISFLSLFLAISPAITYLNAFAVFGLISCYVNFRSLDMAGRMNIVLFRMPPFTLVQPFSRKSRFYFVTTESILLLVLLLGISLLIPNDVFLYSTWSLFVLGFIAIRSWHLTHLISFKKEVEYDS